MDAATQAFLVTVGIVAGILSPIVILIILFVIGGALYALGGKLVIKAKELEKAPPFDDVEANLNPMTKVLSVRFKKNGKTIYQGSATRNDQEAYENVPFTKDQA